MNKRSWIVTVSSDYSIQAVETDLKKEGFEVNEVLAAISNIIGTADSEAIEKIKDMKGITGVSEDLSIDLGSPDAPVTW